MMLNALPNLLLQPLVEQALEEDLGRAGDITTAALIPPALRWQAALVARKDGVLAGLELARLSFLILDPLLAFEPMRQDGDKVQKGETIATIKGSARSLLTAERTALNFLCHLSGIATETNKLVEAVRPYKAKICCTRKTTPGLRALEKYAVRAGGGINHRFGLDDAILIKDNHIAVAGSIKEALKRACTEAGHLVKIELEVDTLAQLTEALDLLPSHPFDVILLDNMDVDTLRQAVKLTAGRVVLEASGSILYENVASVAATGVDIISVGWITHSAPILDIGLDQLL